MAKNTAHDPNSPFAPGPMDDYQAPTTTLVLDGMNQQELTQTLDALEAAIKEKRQLGQLKEALSAAGALIGPLMKPVKPI